MTTVGEILNFIETLAPRELKMDWDNVGLNCGSRTAPVSKILVALDPFEHVCAEAAECGADLLVTHHPLIFRALSAVTDDGAISRGLMNLVKNDISHICAHTNLDCADGGVNGKPREDERRQRDEPTATCNGVDEARDERHWANDEKLHAASFKLENRWDESPLSHLSHHELIR